MRKIGDAERNATPQRSAGNLNFTFSHFSLRISLFAFSHFPFRISLFAFFILSGVGRGRQRAILASPLSLRSTPPRSDQHPTVEW